MVASYDTVFRNMFCHSELMRGLGMADPLHRLSRRERQVLDLVVSGMTSSEIGRELAISPKSVDTYRGRLMAKIGVGNVPGLVKFAMQNGLLQEQAV